MFNFNNWYARVINQPVNVDGYYGDQCVDVVMSWSEWCFPPHKWPELIGYGDAKDLYATADATYFEKIPYKSGLIPQQGDIPIYKGTTPNPEGHTCVVIDANTAGMTVVEQNGYNPNGVAYRASRPYVNLTGFLRPKGSDMSQQDIDNLYKILDQTNKNLDNLYTIVNNQAEGFEKKFGELFTLLDQTNKRLDALEGKK